MKQKYWHGMTVGKARDFFKTRTLRRAASELGVTRGACYAYASRNGIEYARERGGLFFAKSAVELELYARGHSASEIAEKYGVSEPTVRSKLRNFGLKWGCKNAQKCDAEEVRSYASEHSLKECCAKFGMSQGGMSLFMKRHGIKYKAVRICWTQEKVEELRRLAETMTTAEIAEKMKIDKNKIRLAIIRHRIERKKTEKPIDK